MNADELHPLPPAEKPRIIETPWNDTDFEAELMRRSGDWEGAVPWEQLRDEPHDSI